MQILDNVNTLWGDDLKQTLRPGAKLRVAASCFSIYAFESLKKELEKIDSLEFVFTSPTFVSNEENGKAAKERREFYIPRQERDLYGSEFEIQLKNKLTQKAIAKECADWIRRKAKFRSNATKAFMQQFACLSNGEEVAAYTSFHGFTAVDLGYQQGDAFSNIINKCDDASKTQIWLDLFNQIWSDSKKLKDVTDVVCSNIETVYQENSPEKIYFLMLYNIFKEFLEDLSEDVLPNDRTGYENSVVWNKLFNFQRDAATGIINKLESYNGCILADSVGLGKTFTALAVIKYYELRNRSVLVLCPKKIADNWLNYNRNLKTNIFAEDRLNYDVLCHTDLLRGSGVSCGTPLNKVNWGNYDLVVIDESHNFRNDDAYKSKETRYTKLMNSVLRQGVKTKVLMLSATPVNNRFNDLKNQLALAYEGESENLSSKLRTSKTVEAIFRQAQAAFNFWSKLPAEKRTTKAILDALDFDFFKLLDSVTIARSRKHIEASYDTTDTGKFPVRLRPRSFRCRLTKRVDIMDFNDIYKQLSRLKLSIYAPVNYILPSRLKKYEERYDTDVEGGKGKLRQADREKSLQSLMTSNLLKRLESSVASFRLTLNSLKQKHQGVLDKIERFKQSKADFSTDGLAESFGASEEEDDDLTGLEDGVIGSKVQVKLKDMDLPSWECDLCGDFAIVSKLFEEMEKVGQKDDAKLQHLKSHIEDKIKHPINPGNKKVLIFTAFADTADYLYDSLSGELLHSGIHSGKVTGKDAPKTTLVKSNQKVGYDFQSILIIFSPVSQDKSLVLPEVAGEIDVLIGTDCISQGQNLQDCDYLINYDIHWNPVRIIQRFGRVDRIGSTNDSIQLVNYWPDISLDEYINLKERVEDRMVIADVTATGDDNVLSAQANDVCYRREQLKSLQNEVIELEDLKTGINITDLGLNDFRMDLLKYVKSNEDLGRSPNGLHAVISAERSTGLKPGVIFTLRNRNLDVHINQHNRLHPYYLIYIGDDGQVITDHTQVKSLLDVARNSCKGRNFPIATPCKAFNLETEDGRNMEKYSDLLDRSLRSMIEVKEGKDIDSLFSGLETTALHDPIHGLNDFELICFLVVKGEEV